MPVIGEKWRGGSIGIGVSTSPVTGSFGGSYTTPSLFDIFDTTEE